MKSFKNYRMKEKGKEEKGGTMKKFLVLFLALVLCFSPL